MTQNSHANQDPTMKDDKAIEINGGYHCGVDNQRVAKLLDTIHSL
jgi:hypothetical protein